MKQPFRSLSSVSLSLCVMALLSSPGLFAQEATPEGTGPQLAGTYPLPGSLFDRQIVFYFDQPLAPVADPSTLITMAPPLEGTWEQRNGVVSLTLSETTPARGIYRATFQPPLTGISGQAVVAPSSPLLFSNFQLTLAELRYEKIELKTTLIRLNFSAPVTWEQLQQHLTLRNSAGNEVAYTCPRRGPSTVHMLSTPTVAAAPYVVTLSPGLTDASGNFQTTEAIERPLPDATPFSITTINWQHESEDEDSLRLELSLPIRPEAFRDHFQVFADAEESPITLRTVSGKLDQNISYRFDRPSDSYEKLRYRFDGQMEEIPILHPQPPAEGTTLLSLQDLQIRYHNWESEGADPMRLQLFFNAPIDANTLNDYLTVAPPVANLSVTPGSYDNVDISGDWKTGESYKLLIKEGLSDRTDSFRVKEAIAWNPGRAPKRSGVGFAFEAPYYFPRRNAGPLPLYGRNLKEAKATLYEIFPSNLVMAMQDITEGKLPGHAGPSLGKKLNEHTVTFSGEAGERQSGTIPVDGFMPADKKGVFAIQVFPAYDYYNTKLVVWTDIGLLAHWQENELLIYAHNLWDLSPVTGATVTVYSAKHQVMATITSDEAGVARAENWDPELGDPSIVIVESADDYTFLKLNQRGEDTTTFTGAMPLFDAEGYDAFLYADRNLYRPGETMHLRWLVRQADGTPLTGAPLNLRIYDPQDTKREFTETLSNWGSGTLDVATAGNWLTGSYRLELWVPGADMALTTQHINIEDFVPNRLSARIMVDAPYWLPEEEHAIRVHGDHLSGGPARKRKTGAFVILAKRPWQPAQWPAYRFGNDAPLNSDIRDLGEGQTDDSGDALYTFKWKPGAKLSFPVSATLRGEVFEAGGRSVSARTERVLFPSDTLTGLAVSNGTAPDTIDVGVVAVKPDGSPAAPSSVEVTLQKKQWHYYVRRYASHNEANWNDDFQTISTHTVALTDGNGSITIPTPGGYGRYQVVVQQKDNPQFASQSFYAYRGQAHLADASRPSLISLTPDKQSYTLGDTATVQIESPFDGDAIVVVQRDTLETLIKVKVENGVGTLTLSLSAAHAPNVWLECTVIHPVEPGTALTYPYASFAMVNLPVVDPAKALNLRFEGAPEVIRPLSTLDVALHVTNVEGAPVASEVTLALVDEGIHQILEYQNPDPVAWFQRTRRPDYRRAHYYDQVAYDFTGQPIGGGELLKKRLGDDTAIDDSWIKPLALWSGVVETDATGLATFSMAIPEFAGKVRLVAVATTGTESGSVNTNVTIRRPVVMQTSLPRFVAPYDTFDVTALLQNKQEVPVSTTLTVTCAPPLAADAFTQTWDIPAGDEIIATIPVNALEQPGTGGIRWAVESKDAQGNVLDTYEVTTPLPVQAPSVYQSRSELIVLPAGEQRELVNAEFKENEFLEMSLRATSNPLARLRKALDYVVGYPHGCLEQTTSRCLPLYLLGQTASKTGSEWDAAYYKQFIQSGIDRLVAMQTPSGGLGYWPGAEEPYRYGSIYAAHFLTLAKQDPAFNVPEEFHQRLMKYLRERIPLDPGEGTKSLYNYAYACYVRALAKDNTVMEDMTSLDTLSLSTAARQWLALAQLKYTAAPDQTLAYLLKHPSAPYDVKEQGDTLNSTARNDAITLMMQIALGMDANIVQPQAEKLIRYLETHRYSTQEAAFVIVALADYLSTNVGDVSQASVQIVTPDGVEERSGDFQFKFTHKGPGGRYTVVNNGPNALYVHLDKKGILVNPDVAAASNGIQLTRSFRGPSGPVDANQLEHGKNYLVALEIRCDEDFKNLVLVDLLAGGLDIENPRLVGEGLSTWKATGGLQPDFLDVRDDRLIAAFDRLGKGTHRYYYTVRTVSPGTFRHPGASMECMYDGEFNGRTAGSEVTITK